MCTRDQEGVAGVSPGAPGSKEVTPEPRALTMGDTNDRRVTESEGAVRAVWGPWGPPLCRTTTHSNEGNRHRKNQ